MADINVENIVVSLQIADGIDLGCLTKEPSFDVCPVEGADAVMVHVDEPKAAVVLSADGHLMCTGCRDLDDAEAVVKVVRNMLSSVGVSTRWTSDLDIQHIVTSAHLGKKIDARILSEQLKSRAISGDGGMVTYAPRKFPGVVYRLSDGKTVVMVFESGRVVCSGPDAGVITEAVEKMESLVSSVMKKK